MAPILAMIILSIVLKELVLLLTVDDSAHFVNFV